MYGDQVQKLTKRVKSLFEIVGKNNLSIIALAEDSKVRFSMFDMKRRNFAGNNGAIRPLIDSLWANAMENHHVV